MLLRSLPWAYVPVESGRGLSLRRFLARWLRRASTLLALASRGLDRSDRRGRRLHRAPVLEFYAEAGAPEGALYLDGQLVGYLDGVSRL